MLKVDVVKHFKSQAAAARFLGLGRAAVNKWPPVVPQNWAALLHLKTRGKLRYDPATYESLQKKPSRESPLNAA